MADPRAWPNIASEPSTGEAYLTISRPGQPVERIPISHLGVLKLALQAVIAAIDTTSRQPPAAAIQDEDGPGPEIGLYGE